MGARRSPSIPRGILRLPGGNRLSAPKFGKLGAGASKRHPPPTRQISRPPSSSVSQADSPHAMGCPLHRCVARHGWHPSGMRGDLRRPSGGGAGWPARPPANGCEPSGFGEHPTEMPAVGGGVGCIRPISRRRLISPSCARRGPGTGRFPRQGQPEHQDTRTPSSSGSRRARIVTC